MLRDEYTFEIIIRGQSFDVENIKSNFEVMDYEFEYVPLGHTVSKSLNLMTDCDTVFIRKRYRDFSLGMMEFIKLIRDNGRCIMEIKSGYDTRFKIFINADNAQISYSIPIDAMKVLAEIGIDLDFSVLSCGLVEE